MILDLQKGQRQLKNQLEAAYAETAEVKRELRDLKAAASRAQGELAALSAQGRMYLAGNQDDTRAVAAPNPDAPPVTMAAWSFNCMVLSLTSYSNEFSYNVMTCAGGTGA